MFSMLWSSFLFIQVVFFSFWTWVSVCLQPCNTCLAQQMCDTCGFFLENSGSVLTSDFAQDFISGFTSIEHSTFTGTAVCIYIAVISDIFCFCWSNPAVMTWKWNCHSCCCADHCGLKTETVPKCDFSFPGETKNTDGIASRRKLCCSELLRDRSCHGRVLSQKTLVTMQGSMVRGCYCPIPKRKLEWQISVSDVPQQVEREQTKLMQARLFPPN